MSFLRTDSGLSNLCLFTGTNAVVYLEGGSSLSIEQVDAGEFNTCSSDIRFWQTIFTKFQPNHRFEYKSIGCKDTVSKIAKRIESGSVKNVIAVMDRDFDNICKTKINSNNVLYTKGYSWENDCWTPEVIYDAYCILSGSCKTNSTETLQEIINIYIDFEKSTHRYIKLDAILLQNSHSFFDRAKPERYITINSSRRPSFNTQQGKQTLREIRNSLPRPLRKRFDLPPTSLEDCFGHLFEAFGFRVLSFFLKKLSLPNPPKDYATSAVVNAFKDKISDKKSAMHTHYLGELSRVVI